MPKKKLRKSGSTYLKGQMFIVAAVLILIGLVLLFNLVGTPAINEEKKFQETRVLSKNVKNVVKEMKFAAGLATISENVNLTASSYLGQFSSYMRGEMDSEILYAFVFFNGTAQQYSVEVGNYLGDRINATIYVTGSSPPSSSVLLTDKTSALKSFSATGGIINLTLNYTVRNERIVESVKIPAGANNFALGFFDVTLRDRDYMVRIKDVYNRTW